MTGSPVKPAQRPQLVALDRVSARRAVLDPPDVEHGAGEVDLVRRSQTSAAPSPCP
jgi:hypothetical protein